MKRQTQSLPGEMTGKGAKSGNPTLICERQGKSLYHSDKSDLVIQVFNSNGADNGKKRGKPGDIDVLRNQISSYLFEYLEGFHIPTHFVGKASPAEMVVKCLDRLPLAVKVYNSHHSELSRRLGLAAETALEFPIIEHYYVNGNAEGSWVNEFHVYALGIATPEEFKQINRIASKVNAVLRGLCDRRQLFLADLELEFGRHGGQILLGDELSPLTCRFLDLAIADSAKRDRFQLHGEGAAIAFAELCDRLMLKV